MKERPILFSGPMVRAILEGRKTQTRRIVKPQPNDPPKGWYADAYNKTSDWCFWGPRGTPDAGRCTLPFFKCKIGQPGDLLWVRESYRLTDSSDCACYDACACKQGVPMYAADHEAYSSEIGPWKPSIHMPRWASRITLEIESVRAERLNAISAEDAEREGMGCGVNDITGGPVARFSRLWDSINGKGSWDLNPWVWVIQFKRVEAK